jgi:hypothetical protein
MSGKLPFRVIPDMRQLGYSNESPGRMTPNVMLTVTRLATAEHRLNAIETINPAFRLTTLESQIPAIEQRVVELETNGTGSGVSQLDFNALMSTVNELSQTVAQLGNGNSENNGGGGSGVSQADFLNLLMTVNDMSQQIDQLNARQNYANAYLKILDEAIAVEGFEGWEPPV